LGWHSQAVANYTVTIGNNVYAQENLDGKYEWLVNISIFSMYCISFSNCDFLKDKVRPEGTKALSFDFPANFSRDPESYLDAAVTNLFYWNNAIHDLFYLYGFGTYFQSLFESFLMVFIYLDEKSGNFQEDNFHRGGKEDDAVIANAQDGSGYNNANFATPPDGGKGRMRMYVWDVTDPMRDGKI
jgi:extracellular elastinolytic metalloproteinase